MKGGNRNKMEHQERRILGNAVQLPTPKRRITTN